jgi:aminopeptidase N
MDGQNAPLKPTPTLLADYVPYPFAISRTELRFQLAPNATRVTAKLHLSALTSGDLVLDGEGLKLLRIEIDGVALREYELSETDLIIPATALPTGGFVLETEVEIAPAANTALEGLYMSNGMYCTQCEAQGFRKITFYPDRPDVMTRFDVRVEGDLPVLLSNGNPVASGNGWAEWSDPWPKPAYLFALVAGELIEVSEKFTTMDGRDVHLGIWVRPGDETRCDFAMESLIRSMEWDERVWGRVYDLDIFNIVAVDDFNMGAMENKGLNIFNSKLVLASPETATDLDYERIEAVIGHEYFHNWTGNRITCRDWFQLCLKEGLTVYRDQTFTADVRKGAVKRIDDVMTLRARQFREDQGPLSHAVRPDSYVEINNFYTATIYEKGAEIIGMLRTLIGEEAWAAGTALYFDRHDGQACTIEDWLAVFEAASGRDLTQFKRWYTDAGTPKLIVREGWRAEAGVSDDFEGGKFTLTFTQSTAPTPNQPKKLPRVIPIRVALFDVDGAMIGEERVLEMTQPTQSFAFEGLDARPTPSILRGFSAPVMVETDGTPDHRAFLLAHDTDPFNRWEAGRGLAREALAALSQGADLSTAEAYLTALGDFLNDSAPAPAFRALCLQLPSDDEIAKAISETGQTPDPDAIDAAHGALSKAIAARHETVLTALYDGAEVHGPYSPEAEPTGKRALRRAILAHLTQLDGGARAQSLFDHADNMTDQIGALGLLIAHGAGAQASAKFYAQWKDDRLVMDKWFAVELAYAPPAHAVERAAELASHPLFDWKNPNRFRSLLGGLSSNHAGFHRADGAGYRFYGDWLITLDPKNPQTAARMSTAFQTWAQFDAGRRDQAQAVFTKILQHPALSPDLGEMVGRLAKG